MNCTNPNCGMHYDDCECVLRGKQFNPRLPLDCKVVRFTTDNKNWQNGYYAYELFRVDSQTTFNIFTVTNWEYL